MIGAGQAGLAMSRCLRDRGIDHIVLERGRIGERWRTERWDSLRLLTPNWQSRLPGCTYDGPDPDGYMTMADVVAYLERYAAASDAPIVAPATVLSVSRDGDGYTVVADCGRWYARTVVVATGYCDTPFVPAMAARVPAAITQITPTAYRRPGQLPEGGVLIVGASASGLQLADEIHASGRPVVIAVGHHTRLPRTYRGRDILWWLDRMGVFDERVEDVYDVEISRDQPSLQLVGQPDHRTLDLSRLQDAGVRPVGRLLDITGGVARFDDDLVATTAAADVKLAALLARIDRFAHSEGLDTAPAEPFTPCWPRFVDADTSLALTGAGIATIVWATGFRRRYPWLQVPVLDARGEIVHRGGVTPAPGLCVLGLHFQRRRKSSFLDGVGDDARVLADHLAAHLAHAGAALQTESL
ncbi:MAG: NAD(P)-binding domain-containing protein [Vicinamibacterales bacterium]|nr:NAD(P)-binding domain-containing protein [Vicinamibacterales bacterium]